MTGETNCDFISRGKAVWHSAATAQLAVATGLGRCRDGLLAGAGNSLTSLAGRLVVGDRPPRAAPSRSSYWPFFNDQRKAARPSAPSAIAQRNQEHKDFHQTASREPNRGRNRIEHDQ
jgi:hypothetical protein